MPTATSPANLHTSAHASFRRRLIGASSSRSSRKARQGKARQAGSGGGGGGGDGGGGAVVHLP